MIENERVKRFGFTETELERAKKRMLASAESSFKEKDKQMSSSLIYRYMSNFSDGYPSPSLEYTYELTKSFLPTITLAQVNELAPKWMTDENRVIVVRGPEKEGVKMPTETEIRTALKEVEQSKIEVYQDKIVDTKLISEELKGSPVVKEEKIKDFDGTKLTLANGVTVFIKPTDNKDDDVRMQAFSNGGLSLYSAEDLPSASYVSTVKNICGVGKYSSQDLRKVLTGKMVSVSPVMTEVEEMILCSSTVADFETMLQLIYLQLTAPRHDDVVLKSTIDRTKASIQNRKSDPNSAFSDSLQMLMTNYSKRSPLITPEYFDKIDFNRAYAIAEERFKDASDFKFVLIGNVDLVKMKPLIEKYLGSIPDIDRKEFWLDNKVEPKKGKTIKEITVPMKDQKAQVYVHYFGKLPNIPENEEYLKAIQYILRMRYTETIREKEGGTYGVSVSATMASRPTNNYKFTMSFTCDPKKADFLKGLLYDEIKKLKDNGVTEQEVAKTRENFMKEASEKLKDNGYILDRVKNYINNGIYTPLPKYTTDIYTKLNGQKIRKLANRVFGDDMVELVMKPTAIPDSESASSKKIEEPVKKLNPIQIVNGKEVSKDELKAMNPQDFELVYMLKPEAAMAKYGDKGKDGATIIVTKGNTANEPVPDDVIFNFIKQMPVYPGGQSALMEFIKTEIKYPREAQSRGMQGKVFISFVINKSGAVEQPKVIRSVDSLLDAEGLRVVSRMPKWTPATYQGKAVDFQYTIPINFQLN